MFLANEMVCSDGNSDNSSQWQQQNRHHPSHAQRTNNGRCCQRSIVMPSHFLSYDKIIYLLSITSRNKEVDLNYRSGFLWQHFAISLRFDFDENRHGKSFSSLLQFFPFIFLLVMFCLCTQQIAQKEMANDQEMPMKVCLPAYQPVICWTRS